MTDVGEIKAIPFWQLAHYDTVRGSWVIAHYVAGVIGGPEC